MMEKKASNNKIYLVDELSRAAFYGIGTYIAQLKGILSNSDLEFGMIFLNSPKREIESFSENGIDMIHIPSINIDKSTSKYLELVSYLLKIVLPHKNDYKLTFHLNYHIEMYLAKYLKQVFDCQIVYTVHYTHWSLILYGDQIKLYEIYKKRKNEKLDTLEREIIKSIEHDRIFFALCDKIIFIAQHSYDSYKNIIKVDPSKVLIINHAIKDTYELRPNNLKIDLRKKYHIDENCKVILYAGRIDDMKGVSYLIKSYKVIAGTYSNTKLILIGEGDYNRYFKETDPYWMDVIFTGPLPKEKLYEFYSLADIGVVCSIYEEFGYVALEMIMSGLAVITTNAGGLSEITEDGISGIQIPVLRDDEKRYIDSNLLIEKIKLLIDDIAYCQKISQNTRKQYIEKYDFNNFKNRMIDFYRNLS